MAIYVVRYVVPGLLDLTLGQVMMAQDLVLYVVLPLVAVIGLVALGRRLAWWYWGIDRIVSHLESIDESLQQLPAVAEHRARRRYRA